jgi:hypothetical protein
MKFRLFVLLSFAGRQMEGLGTPGEQGQVFTDAEPVHLFAHKVQGALSVGQVLKPFVQEHDFPEA